MRISSRFAVGSTLVLTLGIAPCGHAIEVHVPTVPIPRIQPNVHVPTVPVPRIQPNVHVPAVPVPRLQPSVHVIPPKIQPNVQATVPKTAVTVTKGTVPKLP